MSRAQLTHLSISFVRKCFNMLVNAQRERACSISVSLALRTGLELFSALMTKSP
jgi:hypothetical protein